MHTGRVTIGYLGIALVLVVGIAIVVYGWLSDRADTRRRQDALTQAPDRPIPGHSPDAAAPAYVSEYEVLHQTDYHPTATLTDTERTDLQRRLKSAPTLPHGHAATEFTTDEPSGLCVLAHPWILVADHDITTVRELLPFFEKTRGSDHRLVVVAPSIGRDVLATMQVNAVKQTLSCAVVVIPDAGQRRALCSLVGAVPIPWEDLRAGYVPVSGLGTCATWVSSADQLWVLQDDSNGP